MDPLEVVSRGNEIHRVLGRGATPLVKLVATPNLPGVDHSQAGLFHTAFLFENQASLASIFHGWLVGDDSGSAAAY